MREAIETRMKVDDSGEIMKLEHYCPWKEHLYELEQELTVQQPLKFCLYEVRYLTRVEADASILVALESLPLMPCVLASSILAPPGLLRPVMHMHYCCASLQHDSGLTHCQGLTPTYAISGPCRMAGEGSGGCRRNLWRQTASLIDLIHLEVSLAGRRSSMLISPMSIANAG